MINSCQKGKRGELEVAHLLTDLFQKEGFNVTFRRSQQYCGDAGHADVVGLPSLFIEVKNVQKINIDEVLDKAEAQSRNSELVLLFFKSNRTEWKVAFKAKNLILLSRVLASLEKIAPQNAVGCNAPS